MTNGGIRIGHLLFLLKNKIYSVFGLSSYRTTAFLILQTAWFQHINSKGRIIYLFNGLTLV